MSNPFNRSYPMCAFPIESSKQVAVDMCMWTQERRPAALIRLGDGEGMVLARPTPDDDHLWAHVQQHFGPDVAVEYIESMANSLESAMRGADYVGIRDDMIRVDFPEAKLSLPERKLLKTVKRKFFLRPAEKNLPFSSALRLAHTHRALSRFEFHHGTKFCSAWVHFMLSSDNSLLKVLASESEIGLISSKRRLANELKNKLNKKVDFYEVQDIRASKQSPDSSVDYDLDSFRRVADALRVRHRGQVFLVGAGVWGKIYCHQIKKQGGIAIDIGSVCDSWIGIASREMVYRSLFQTTNDNVPTELLLTDQLARLNAND